MSIFFYAFAAAFVTLAIAHAFATYREAKLVQALAEAGELLHRVACARQDLVVEHERYKRHMANVMQDSCEGALIEATYYDAVRQALHAIDPNHPVLTGAPPDYGVWASLRQRADALELENARLRAQLNFPSFVFQPTPTPPHVKDTQEKA